MTRIANRKRPTIAAVAIAFAAVIALSSPASAAQLSGTKDCPDAMSAQVNGTPSGTTTLYWGAYGNGYTDWWTVYNAPAGTTTSYKTGINYIQWKVVATTVSSASGTCYDA